MRFLFLCALVCGAGSFALADSPKNPAPATTSTGGKAAIEKIQTGELRLDGKISALLGAGLWQLEATSWTSPRGVTTDFDDLKTKEIRVGAKAFIHPLGDATPVPLKEVKLASHIAVIGKPGAEGSVVAREIVLLEGYGARKTVGTLPINPDSMALIDRSRAARDDGQLPKALKLAQEAVSTAQGYHDLSGEALATNDVAGLSAELEQPERAMSAFKRVQAIGDQIGNSLAQVLGLNGQARLLAAGDKTDEAISLLERAASLGATTPTALRVSTLGSLASIYIHVKKRTEAVGALTRLFPLEDESGQKDQATGTLLTLALLLANTEKETARGYLDQARPRLEFVRDDAAKMQLSLSLAFALKALDDPGAGAAFESTAKMLEAKGDAAGAAKIRAMATKGATAPLPTDEKKDDTPQN